MSSEYRRPNSRAPHPGGARHASRASVECISGPTSSAALPHPIHCAPPGTNRWERPITGTMKVPSACCPAPRRITAHRPRLPAALGRMELKKEGHTHVRSGGESAGGDQGDQADGAGGFRGQPRVHRSREAGVALRGGHDGYAGGTRGQFIRCDAGALRSRFWVWGGRVFGRLLHREIDEGHDDEGERQPNTDQHEEFARQGSGCVRVGLAQPGQ